MEFSNVASKRLNVLVLDGGGVRGLSSLLILRALMAQVNENIDSVRLFAACLSSNGLLERQSFCLGNIALKSHIP